MTLRESFVRQFGEQEARTVEASAKFHIVPMGQSYRKGSDPFLHDVMACVCFCCFETDSARHHHGFRALLPDIKRWIFEECDFGQYDGVPSVFLMPPFAERLDVYSRRSLFGGAR